MNWGKYAWLKRGNRRIEILKQLSKSKMPLTINDLKLKAKIALPQASVTVKELLDKQLIDCLNPQDKIGKLYKINKEGVSLLENLQ